MDSMYIKGYPIIWDTKTKLYEYDGISYYEKISRNAISGADLNDCALTYNHDGGVMIMAATKNHTLALIPDNKGLLMRAKLVDTTAGRDLYELIRTRTLDKMSFAFICGAEEFDRDTRTRTVKGIKKMVDVSVVHVPAYPQTSVRVMTPEEVKVEEKRSKLQQELRLAIAIGEFEKERGKRYGL